MNSANDPAPVPHPEPMHGSYHWAFERQVFSQWNGRIAAHKLVLQAHCGCARPSYHSSIRSWHSQPRDGRDLLRYHHNTLSHWISVCSQSFERYWAIIDSDRSVIIDYVPWKRLPKTRVFFMWGLRAATLTVAVGLYEFETNDVGLTEGIKRIWMA